MPAERNTWIKHCKNAIGEVLDITVCSMPIKNGSSYNA